jgi:cysteine desulfurase/selenocysteine lyase
MTAHARPAGTFDPLHVRGDFPILSRRIYGKPLVYLDSAASAQKPDAVLAAMNRLYHESYANVHRGVHFLSTAATEAYENARATVARFINAEEPGEIIFTKGGTQAINIVASGFAPRISEGDEIVLTEMEHHSNIVPWHFLRERKGAVLRFAPITDDGALDLAAFERLLSPRTKIVAVTHMSNVLGTIVPLADIVRLAHARGILVLADGCQGAVHVPVDVQALGCDFYAFTGHKLYGPTGIGVLYGKRDKLKELPPFEGGGEMIREVTQEKVTYAAPPHRFEAGTPPIAEAVGLAAAIGYLQRLDRTAVVAHEDALRAHATEELSRLNRVRIFGRAPGKGAIVSFAVEGVHAHDLATVMDRAGVAVRAGHHCAQPLMRRLGVTATARASFALYNTRDEIESLVRAVREAREFFA